MLVHEPSRQAAGGQIMDRQLEREVRSDKRRVTVASSLVGIAGAAMIWGFWAAPVQAQEAMNALVACYREKTIEHAIQNCDSADMVVDATHRMCSPQEWNFHEALLKAGGVYGRQMADRIFEGSKAKAHVTLLKLVEKTRAEKSLCR
jgi:hypothetical protein